MTRIWLMPVLVFFSFSSVSGQTYFEGLYGSVENGNGISTDGTLPFDGGYLTLSYNYLDGRSVPHFFVVDDQGVLLDSVTFQQSQMVHRQPQNIIALNDTVFLGLTSFRNLNEPSSARGDFCLVEFDDLGQELSTKYYGDTLRKEIPQDLIVTMDNGRAMVGQAVIDDGLDDDGQIILFKTDNQGNELWSQEYGGSLYDAGSNLVQTPDQGFLLLGWTRSFGAGQRDFYLVKTDSVGDQQWQRTYGGGGNEGGWSINELSDGNYLLVGGGSDDGVNSYGRLIKVNGQGDVIWNEDYIMQSGNSLFMTVELEDGSLVSTGLTTTSGESNAGWLIKTDNEGELLWQRKFNRSTAPDLFYSILATEDGGFLLSGQAINDSTNSQDAWLLKVDSVGCPYPNCTVGINELEPTEVVVDVWPNPVSDVVQLSVNSSALNGASTPFGSAQGPPLSLTVMDMQGRTVHNSNLTAQTSHLDVSDWPNGLYVISVVGERVQSTVRVVVQH